MCLYFAGLDELGHTIEDFEASDNLMIEGGIRESGGQPFVAQQPGEHRFFSAELFNRCVRALADNPKRARAVFLVFAFFNQQRLANAGKSIVTGMICDGLKDRIYVGVEKPLNVNAKHS
ncbi:hypothetical protein [Marinobacter halophilus]|uniref:hypothetical protein n=1 Tax=Marinobacter halophilus TaxID=1323740 RepID=UPI001D0F6DAA|nr:hypothetical protein [Marinobacter halophilus]